MEKTELDLTLKQRKWIKEYITTGNATEAAARVYDCKDRDSANAIGNENLAKLSFPELMEEMKLTDVALMNVGAEGLQATKQISGVGNANSKSVEFIEVPDYAIRHRYWETLLKLKKRLGQEGETNINVQNNTLISLDAFSERMQKRINERLTKQP
jgi:hypothetical protein